MGADTPELPPSRWKLDHIPENILDNIVDFLAEDAIASKPPARQPPGMSDDFSMFFIGYPEYVHFSKDLKRLSLVDKLCRQNVISRKIASRVVLTSQKQTARLNERMTPATREYVRFLSIADRPKAGDRVEWAKDRHDLISSFKNLTDIQDESGEIARYQTPLPTTMDSIGIMLQSGDYPAVPLPTRKVDRLRIEADHAASKLELEGGRESMLFQEKVKVLTQNISSVTLLEWKPAALSTCGCSHGKKHNLPAEARYEDPLAGKRFGMIDTLTLEVPFATINPGSMREDQWWGYLGWLTTTKAEFKTLQITMQWDPSFLRGPAIGPDFILESLGTQLKSTFVPGQQMPQLQGQGMCRTLHGWSQKMMNNHKTLEKISIAYILALPNGQPGRVYRKVIVTRAGFPYRTHEIKYEEQYKQELMQWIDDVMLFLEQGFEPPLPHDFTREDFLRLKKQYPDAPFMDDFLRERGRR